MPIEQGTKTVLHVCNTDGGTGAGRAAYRLHRGLLARGVESRMLVGHSTTGDPTVWRAGTVTWNMLRRVIDSLPNLVPGWRTAGNWSNGWLPRLQPKCVKTNRDVVVNVHWIGEGFWTPARAMKLGEAVVWTLHDCRAFTGGCHYPGACRRFEAACGRCPMLQSGFTYDLSRWNALAVRRLRQDHACAVAPSRWMKLLAERSRLWPEDRITHIRNGVELDVFRPIPRELACDLLGLDARSQYIGFCAVNANHDRRKGGDILEEALSFVEGHGSGGSVKALVIGGRLHSPRKVGKVTVEALGVISDELKMALVLSMLEVMVVPSREDNLPQTAVEALACGTPVVGFRIGGMPEIVEDGVSGFLAEPFEAASLGGLISRVLSQRGHLAMRASARAVAKRRFDVSQQAEAYEEIYDVVRQGARRR